MFPRRLALVSTALFFVACSTEDKGTTGTDTSTAASTTGATSEPTTGASTGPTTGAVPTGPECQQDSDCMLVNNCCECDPKPVDAVVAPCEGTCLQSTCEAEQLGDNIPVACRSGICEFAEVACGDGPVGCGAQKPTCPEGKSLAVVADCWACVHPRYCTGSACTPGSCGDGWTCVPGQSGASTCAPIPHECGGTPTCSCVAPYLDEFCGGSCSETPDGLLCEDGG